MEPSTSTSFPWKVQEIQLYDPSLSSRGAQGVNLISFLESQTFVSNYHSIHSKALIAITRDTVEPRLSGLLLSESPD